MRCLLAGLIETVPLSFYFKRTESLNCNHITFFQFLCHTDNKEPINSEVSLIVYPIFSASSDVNSLLFIVIYIFVYKSKSSAFYHFYLINCPILSSSLNDQSILPDLLPVNQICPSDIIISFQTIDDNFHLFTDLFCT